MLGTLTRAGAVLDLFSLEEPEWGVTAVAQRLGSGKSLAHDVLTSLGSIGLLARVGHGRYRLGWRTVSLATVLLRTNELKAHARSIVRGLVARQGLTVSPTATGGAVAAPVRQAGGAVAPAISIDLTSAWRGSAGELHVRVVTAAGSRISAAVRDPLTRPLPDRDACAARMFPVA